MIVTCLLPYPVIVINTFAYQLTGLLKAKQVVKEIKLCFYYSINSLLQYFFIKGFFNKINVNLLLHVSMFDKIKKLLNRNICLAFLKKINLFIKKTATKCSRFSHLSFSSLLWSCNSIHLQRNSSLRKHSSVY